MGREINVSVAETKAKLSEKIRACRELGRTFIITSHGKPRAVLMSYEAYAGLIEKEQEPTIMDAKRWHKERSRRKEVAREIKELFDERKLSRKGQKGYKRRAVKRMESD